MLEENFDPRFFEREFSMVVEENEHFISISLEEGGFSFIIYKDMDLMCADMDGERYSMPVPITNAHFVSICEMFHLDIVRS